VRTELNTPPCKRRTEWEPYAEWLEMDNWLGDLSLLEFMELTGPLC